MVSASGYISFLTVGGSENRAWLIRKGATAQEAGGAIHTDIQKGFIRVEIIGYDDFVAAGGETQAKHTNKMRVETKSYVMQDYDLANFRFKLRPGDRSMAESSGRDMAGAIQRRSAYESSSAQWRTTGACLRERPA